MLPNPHERPDASHPRIAPPPVRGTRPYSRPHYRKIGSAIASQGKSCSDFYEDVQKTLGPIGPS